MKTCVNSECGGGRTWLGVAVIEWRLWRNSRKGWRNSRRKERSLVDRQEHCRLTVLPACANLTLVIPRVAHLCQ